MINPFEGLSITSLGKNAHIHIGLLKKTDFDYGDELVSCPAPIIDRDVCNLVREFVIGMGLGEFKKETTAIYVGVPLKRGLEFDFLWIELDKDNESDAKFYEKVYEDVVERDEVFDCHSLKLYIDTLIGPDSYPQQFSGPNTRSPSGQSLN